MEFKDHFSGHAADYASHRPTYPGELFEFLAGLVPRRSLAWDSATGSGQAAVALAGWFDRVIGTDASAQQIASAACVPGNLELRVAKAEDSGLPDRSVDLVTVAQALHWFDFAAFYAEVRRVLAPGGALAVWCYELTRVSPEVDVIIDRFYRGKINAFWPPERGHIESGYREIPFPFQQVVDVPEFSMAVEWTADDLLNYLQTWSAVRRYIAVLGDDPVGDLEPELQAAWGGGRRSCAGRWCCGSAAATEFGRRSQSLGIGRPSLHGTPAFSSCWNSLVNSSPVRRRSCSWISW